MASFNLLIWKYLYDKGLRTAADVELAAEKGVISAEEKVDILG